MKTKIEYSHNQPTQPGWYWCRTTEPWEAVVRIDRLGDALFCTWLTAPGHATVLFEQDWLPETLWAGPIAPPGEEGKNYPDTFKISEDGKSITCLRCKRTSYNLNDVEHRYCGFCHMFHDDIYPPAREWWIKNPPAAEPGESNQL